MDDDGFSGSEEIESETKEEIIESETDEEVIESDTDEEAIESSKDNEKEVIEILDDGDLVLLQPRVSKRMETTILSGNMLTADIVNQAMDLIKIQTSHPGLENTSRQQEPVALFDPARTILPDPPCCSTLDCCIRTGRRC